MVTHTSQMRKSPFLSFLFAAVMANRQYHHNAKDRDYQRKEGCRGHRSKFQDGGLSWWRYSFPVYDTTGLTNVSQRCLGLLIHGQPFGSRPSLVVMSNCSLNSVKSRCRRKLEAKNGNTSCSSPRLSKPSIVGSHDCELPPTGPRNCVQRSFSRVSKPSVARYRANVSVQNLYSLDDRRAKDAAI